MGDLRWYRVLALWKLIVFMEGNYRRAQAGSTDDPYLTRFGEGIEGLAEHALALTRRSLAADAKGSFRDRLNRLVGLGAGPVARTRSSTFHQKCHGFRARPREVLTPLPPPVIGLRAHGG